MDSSNSSPTPLIHPLISPIPIDLFVLKKSLSLNLKFNDACVLLDADDNPLIFIGRNIQGGWEGFGGGGELIFKVEKKFVSQFNGVVAAAKDAEDVIKVKESPFHRSCTIYKGNSIMAQTSLLYKLGKLTTGRKKFRVTCFLDLLIRL
ncbi:hypothetical protein MKX01_030916 [Papaver californicum]|nr:hypothetical protein MKX01_030916 [Papaver californicum]